MLKCPVCSAELTEIQKFNVYIDVCQNCKGIWLDRGELEKILEIVKQEKIAVERVPKEHPKNYKQEHPNYHYKYEDEHKYKHQDYQEEYYYKNKHKYSKSKKEKISKVIETIFNIFD